MVTIRNILFRVLVLGEFITAPSARPPNATQYRSPPLMVKIMPPAVPGVGGTTVTWGCGPGPFLPSIETVMVNTA